MCYHTARTRSFAHCLTPSFRPLRRFATEDTAAHTPESNQLRRQRPVHMPGASVEGGQASDGEFQNAAGDPSAVGLPQPGDVMKEDTAMAASPDVVAVVDGQYPPPPPDAFRFDPLVAPEPLGMWTKPSDHKRQQMVADDKTRHEYLNEASFTAEQKAEKAQGYKNCQFNQFVSDHLSLHRRGRDTRVGQCYTQSYYPVAKMPTVSVVIVFYNEARSTLLRTAWSVLDRTDARLIKEVILVDDGSTSEHLGTQLEQEVAGMPKTHVIRMVERGGLIRAKVHGVENATGEVMVFIDSHCEVNDGWLEPLLDRIVRNRKTIAMPVIDVIDMNTFEVKQAVVEKGVSSWTLYFYWLSPQNHIMEKGKIVTGIEPILCPVMAGGIFAIDRDYFYESGAYDMGQDTWGGENIEMSFRLWMCGGTLEVMPCSRISHVFRNRSPYSFKDRNPSTTIAHNLNRVAEVWMDKYADVYYNITGNRAIGHGDVSERKAFRTTNQCKSFKWYLDTVTPYMFIPMPEHYYHYGKLRNVGRNQCVNHDGVAKGSTKAPKLQDCSQNWGHGLEWYLTKHPFDGQVRHEASYGSRCIHVEKDLRSPTAVSLVRCYDYEDGSANLQWSLVNGQLRSQRHDQMCLVVNAVSEFTMHNCASVEHDDYSKWEFLSAEQHRDD